MGSVMSIVMNNCCITNISFFLGKNRLKSLRNAVWIIRNVLAEDV